MQFARKLFVCSIAAAMMLLALAVRLYADTISGTVKDPSGAVVAGARIEITGGGLSQALVLITDDSGKFSAPNLSAGKYSVKVSKDGFDDLVTTVDLKGTAELPLNLTIAAQQAQVTVTEKNLAFANSDVAYRQLRGVGFGDSYRCDNVSLRIDVGAFQFASGTLTFLAPVNNVVTGAIFVGQGHFTLTPVAPINTQELMRRTAKRPRRKISPRWCFASLASKPKFSLRELGPRRRRRRARRQRSSAGKTKCATGTKCPRDTRRLCWKAKQLTTWTRTCSPPFTIPIILRFSTPTCTARRTRTCVFSFARSSVRCRKWILRRK